MPDLVISQPGLQENVDDFYVTILCWYLINLSSVCYQMVLCSSEEELKVREIQVNLYTSLTASEPAWRHCSVDCSGIQLVYSFRVVAAP